MRLVRLVRLGLLPRGEADNRRGDRRGGEAECTNRAGDPDQCTVPAPPSSIAPAAPAPPVPVTAGSWFGGCSKTPPGNPCDSAVCPCHVAMGVPSGRLSAVCLRRILDAATKGLRPGDVPPLRCLSTGRCWAASALRERRGDRRGELRRGERRPPPCLFPPPLRRPVSSVLFTCAYGSAARDRDRRCTAAAADRGLLP